MLIFETTRKRNGQGEEQRVCFLVVEKLLEASVYYDVPPMLLTTCVQSGAPLKKVVVNDGFDLLYVRRVC
jgi:hypothetical protein